MANVKVQNGRLAASGDFSADAETGFDRACQELLAGKEKSVVVDLTEVLYFSSTYVGLLAEMCLGARSAGKAVKVRAGPKIAALLREAGLAAAAAIEEVRS
jgi:anti-anti-sigma regulatory factor